MGLNLSLKSFWDQVFKIYFYLSPLTTFFIAGYISWRQFAFKTFSPTEIIFFILIGIPFQNIALPGYICKFPLLLHFPSRYKVIKKFLQRSNRYLHDELVKRENERSAKQKRERVFQFEIHFKQKCQGMYIVVSKNSWYFSYFRSKHRLWVLVRTASERRF